MSLPLPTTSQLAGASFVAVLLWAAVSRTLNVHDPTLEDFRGPPSAGFLQGSFGEVSEADGYRLFERWASEYGHSYVFRSFFNSYKLYTSDLRALNHITTSDVYEKSEVVRFILGKMVGRGLLFVEGDRHKQMRKITNPAFGLAQIRSLTPVFFEKSLELREIWTSFSARSSRRDGKCEINVFGWMDKLALDIIGLAGFNYAFDSIRREDDDRNELNKAVRDMFSFDYVSPSFIIQLLIPATRVVPTDRTRIQARSLEVIRRIGSQMIADKKSELVSTSIRADSAVEKNSIEGRDLLSLLIKSNMAVDVESDARMSDEELLAQVVSFLVAGHETTSTALTWILFSLAVHPSVQSKLRAELQLVGSDAINMDEVDGLEYLDATVREGLRYHSPLATTERVATRDDVIPLDTPYVDKDGVTRESIRVKKGDNILVPIRAVNRSKELWGEDAEEFRPERWLQSAIPDAAKRIPGIYSHMMTFLGGTHSCVGYRFAMVEMKVILFTLIRAFEFRLAISPEDIGRKANIVGRPYVISDPESGTQLPLTIRLISS
ncbi:cytochrome P450 [Punctularia strigosozonata HHB-11173 SS5]|uniref:cytochrome P450 n=1 Tax=Punctularia strigosozonata (strain HHB-11173) TaxID=741275 RepID=UPI000441662B|nr:cytochrome P450 [Punctularia strigosozonata HHB-11173 SS5]EIN09254.1 cytochrome P450 [Punctularia strigosozonata HHB-11173 SS5]